MGGLISILMILALSGFLFSKVKNFFEQSEITVSQEILMQDDPDQLKLPSNKFMFAVKIDQEFTDFIENPVFLVYVRQNNYFNVEGTQKKDKKKIPLSMEPCTLDHWKNIEGGLDYKYEFEKSQFQEWLCPTAGQDIQVGGQYASNEFNFIRFEIASCETDPEKDAEYFPNWNYTCMTQEQMDHEFEEKGDVKFKIRYTSYYVNSQSKEPVNAYLEELTYSLQPGQLYRQANIFIQDHRIKTDNKIFPSFSDHTKQNNVPILAKSETSEEVLLGFQQGIQARFYFRRSTITLDYDRSFLTLSDLLSYIGGFAEIIYIFFSGFAIFLNQQHQLITVANSIYNFEESEQNKEKLYKKYKEKKLQTFKSQKSNASTLGSNNKKNFQHEITYQKEQIKNLKTQKANQGRRITNIIQETLGFKNKLDFIIFHLQDYVHRIAKINFSMQYIAFTITGGKAFRNSRNLQLEKAIKLANNQTDLSIILQRLTEIDKLKKIILDREQQRLFDFAPKPLIKVIKTDNNTLEKVVVQGGQTKNEDYSPINKSDIKQPKINKLFSENQSDSMSEASAKEVKNSILRESLKANFKTYMLVLEAKNKFMRVIKFRRKYQKQMKDNEVYLNLYQSYLNVAGRLNNPTPQNLALSQSQLKNSMGQSSQSKTSHLQAKINKELIAQMGLEMKEIFELSQILEIKYLTKKTNQGLSRSFTGVEQSVTPSQIYSKKDKQVMELSFNGNSTYQNNTKIQQLQQQQQNQTQNDQLSQFDNENCSFDQYINTNRNYCLSERSQINTEREKFKEQMDIMPVQQQPDISNKQQQQNDEVDNSDWALPHYAQKEMDNTKRNMDSCRVDTSRQ